MKTADAIEKRYKDIMDFLMLNDGYPFNTLLQKERHWHLYKNKVNSPQKSYFEIDVNNLIWPKNYDVYTHYDDEQHEWFEFFIKLDLKTELCEYGDDGVTYMKSKVQLDIVIHATTYSDQAYISFKNINLLNTEHFILLKYNKSYLDEVKRIKATFLAEETFNGVNAISFYTEIWKSKDFVLEEYKKHTDLYFFYDLAECHRNIMYSIGNLNMWGRYTTNFKDDLYSHNGRDIYPVNLTQIDFRFHFFMESAIEEIYTFYEKIAFMLYIHLSPLNSIKNIRALSLANLFSHKTIREIVNRHEHLNHCSHMKWFENRVKTVHKSLQNYRHPLVHYQHDQEVRGTYAGALQRRWLSSSADIDSLNNIFEESSLLVDFINNEFKVCKIGFEHAVLLVSELSNNPISQS